MSAQASARTQSAPAGATAKDVDLDEILRMTDARRSAVMGPPDDIEKVVILLAKAGGLDDIRRSLPAGSSTRAVRFLAGFVKCARQELVNRKGAGQPDDPRLFRCSTASILEALKLAALVDVVPGDGRAYLIAYGSECKFELGAHGMRDVMRRSSAILDVNDQVIYEGDEFDVELDGPSRGVRHKRRSFGKGRKWVATYATVLLRDDPRPIVEIIDEADLDAIKSQAKAKGSLAWTTFVDEMSRAKALRRISKRVPMRPDDAAALQSIDAANFLMQEAASEGAGSLRRSAAIHATIDPADLSPSTDANRGHDRAAPQADAGPEGPKLSQFADEEQELILAYLERKAGIADREAAIQWLARWEAGPEDLMQRVWDDYNAQKAEAERTGEGELFAGAKGKGSKSAIKG